MLRAVVNGIERQVAPGATILDLLGATGIERPVAVPRSRACGPRACAGSAPCGRGLATARGGLRHAGGRWHGHHHPLAGARGVPAEHPGAAGAPCARPSRAPPCPRSRSTARSTATASPDAAERPRFRRRRSTTRTPTSTSTCPGASSATAACGSATRSRASPSGTCSAAATTAGSSRTRGDAARELLRQLRRLRGHLPDRRARGQAAARAGPADELDPHRPAPTAASAASWRSAPADGRIVQVRPRSTRPSTRATSASRAATPSSSSARRTGSPQPLIRRRGRLAGRRLARRAIGTVAEQLAGVLERHGPDAIGVLGSARATNEDNYVTQKFARAVLGTNNVDCCARVCHTPSAAALKRMLGTGAATNSFDDIELAGAILLAAAANPTENHPIVGARIRSRCARGAPLIVIDPRADRARRGARPSTCGPGPGTNIPLLNALAARHPRRGRWPTKPSSRERVDGLDAFRRVRRALAPGARRGASAASPPATSARPRGSTPPTRPAMCFHGLGITEHVQGTEGVMCLDQPRAAHRQPRPPRRRREPAARAEQRAGRGPHGLRARHCSPAARRSRPGARALRARCGAPRCRPRRACNLLEMIDAGGPRRAQGAVDRRLRRPA